MQASFDIFYFLVFLYSLIIFLAISNFIIADQDSHLVPTLINQYMQMFGNNPKLTDMINEDNSIKTRLVMYLISSNIIVVICLNILISIVCD